jgi:hypothetical protein
MQGLREDPKHCALANYLRRITGIDKLLVGPDKTVFPGGEVPNPVEIRAFIWRFDYGYLPELDQALELEASTQNDYGLAAQ